jgi:alpha-D-ribose 1-methylphosphonate 5-triphosphate synthase subunit PhnH
VDADLVEGGFADPSLETQSVFRALMTAMSEPGRIVDLAPELSPPPALPREAAAVVCTLCDPDTPVWLAPGLRRAAAVADWIAFQTGAPQAADAAGAAFALSTDAAELPDLGAFAQGSDAYPDRSTTLILWCEAMSNDAGWTLTGPGIEHGRRLGFQPAPPAFPDQWAANRERFPRGVDLILCARGAVAAMPRTVRLDRKGA